MLPLELPDPLSLSIEEGTPLRTHKEGVLLYDPPDLLSLRIENEPSREGIKKGNRSEGDFLPLKSNEGGRRVVPDQDPSAEGVRAVEGVAIPSLKIRNDQGKGKESPQFEPPKEGTKNRTFFRNRIGRDMIRPRDLHLNRGKEGGLIIENKG